MNKIVKISDSFQAKLRDMNLLLEKTAKTDMLTGLANRRDALMKLDIEKTRSERYKRCFSILLLDIDNFKKVNDQYGHEAGDFILVELAKEMLRSVRREDTCARWGGEEFLMILPETSLDGAFNLGNKLREKVESLQFNYNRILLTITISIGVTEYFINEVIDECIRRADLALYRAKSEGRNCVIAF
jgi:diguanylate cyclase (GGDEF)-like protein